MSRLDFFTIFVVALCIIAIIFLIFKAMELAKGDTVNSPENTNIVAEPDNGLDGETYDEDSMYDDEDESNIIEEGVDAGVDALNEGADAVGDAVKKGSSAIFGDGDSDSEEETGDAGSGELEDSIPVPAEEEEAEIISSNDSRGQYLVLAGAFRIKANGDVMTNKLRRMGYSNARTAIFDKGTYAVALVDRFDSKSEASKLASELKNSGIEAYVQVASR